MRECCLSQIFRALVKAWRAVMKWFALLHHAYLCERYPSDDDMTLEKKDVELEKLSTSDLTEAGLFAISECIP